MHELTEDELSKFGYTKDEFLKMSIDDKKYLYKLIRVPISWKPFMTTKNAQMYSLLRTKTNIPVVGYHGTTKKKAINIIKNGFEDRYNSKNANFLSYDPSYSCEYGKIVFVCYVCLKNPMPINIFNSFDNKDNREELIKQTVNDNKYDGYYGDRNSGGSFMFVWDPKSIVIIGTFTPKITCELSNRTLAEMKYEGENIKSKRSNKSSKKSKRRSKKSNKKSKSKRSY